jgi:hypothetical protein
LLLILLAQRLLLLNRRPLARCAHHQGEKHLYAHISVVALAASSASAAHSCRHVSATRIICCQCRLLLPLLQPLDQVQALSQQQLELSSSCCSWAAR